MKTKVDLVMWTKDGASTLPEVLKRINSIIPSESVNQRLIIDDTSTDQTLKIAESLGWTVIPNEGTGISNGANTALRHVKTDWFISFEQDLLLSYDWWQKVPPRLSDSRVAIASGVRFVHYPPALKKIQEFTAKNYKSKDNLEQFIPYVKTLDNTIYKTAMIRKLGGFPNLQFSAGVDHVLAQRVFSAGYRWFVDYDVKSIHLRTGLADDLAHNYWYGACSDQLGVALSRKPAKVRILLLRLLFTPIRGLQIAIKTSTPASVYVYPRLRLAFLKGLIASRKQKN